MFLALRELLHARSRFTLMGSVVALISVLMVLLAGLSSGLVNDGVSGLQRMPVQAVAFAPETRTDSAFTRSVVGPDQVEAWAARPDVESAAPMGLSIINAKTSTDTPVDLTLVGADPDGPLVPAAAQGAELVTRLAGAPVLFEAVYDPWPTPLVAASGGVVVSGLDLLVHQACLQFELFTGLDAPLDAMRRAGERALAERTATR